MTASKESRYAYNKGREASSERGDEEEVFEAYLRRKSLKFTAARRQLLHKIFGMHDHFTADQLLDRLKLDRLRVSKATVYRTLGVMLDCGLLDSHDFGEGSLYYEHTHGHARHEHMFCVGCKHIIEFRSEEIDAQLTRIAADMGFNIFSHSLKLFGLCEECGNDKQVEQRFLTQGGAGSQDGRQA